MRKLVASIALAGALVVSTVAVSSAATETSGVTACSVAQQVGSQILGSGSHRHYMNNSAVPKTVSVWYSGSAFRYTLKYFDFPTTTSSSRTALGTLSNASSYPFCANYW